MSLEPANQGLPPDTDLVDFKPDEVELKSCGCDELLRNIGQVLLTRLWIPYNCLLRQAERVCNGNQGSLQVCQLVMTTRIIPSPMLHDTLEERNNGNVPWFGRTDHFYN